MKNLKTFESFSKIYESSGEKTTEEVITKYQQMPGMWDMAKNQYYYVITGDEYTMEELKEYLKQLTDQGIIHNDVKDDILYLVKNLLNKK